MHVKKVLLVLFLAAAWNLSLPAAEIDDFKVQLQKIADEPFAGTPSEYKAFAQKQGKALIGKAEQMLALPNLSPDDARFALLRKYWGLVREFGFDDAVFDEKLSDFMKSLHNVPEAEVLYKSLMHAAFNSRSQEFYSMETSEAIKAFLPFRETFVPFIDKFYREEDGQSQLASRLVITADFIDQDGSAGLLASTVEMLMPTLKEQEKSKDSMTEYLAKNLPNGVRRAQMPGKEMKLEGIDLDGKVVDVKDFAEKVVYIQFATTDSKDMLPILKKLDALLRDHGFVFLDYNTRDNRQVARVKAEELELPWTILCRRNAYEQKLEDYYGYYNVRSCMFLVGRDGKVIGTWSRGLCSAVWEALKTQFPAQAEELAKLAAEDEQIRQENKEKSRQIRLASGNETDGTGSETAEMLMKHLGVMNGADRNMGTDKERTQKMLELSNLIRTLPDLSASQKNSALMQRVGLLDTLARMEMQEHPETNPAIIFAEMLQAVDEALADEKVNQMYNNNLVLNKISVLHAMWAYMKRSDDKPAIARDILNRYVEILKKETQHTNPYGGDNLKFFGEFVVLRDLQNDDHDPDFVQAFFDSVIPIFETAKDPELHEFAERLRGAERRVCSIGKEFEFECMLMNGEPFNVKPLRGKIVLVNFWATWCGPCLREFPNMKTQYEKYKEKGYEMIALSTDEEVKDIVEFQEKNDYPWLVGSLVKSRDAGLVDYHAYYGIQGIPTTFLLDRTGKVLFRMVGSDDEVLNEALRKAFGE